MANNKTINQPGSNDAQPGRERSRNQNAQNSGGQRPNGEKTMTNTNKTKQGEEDNHNLQDISKSELADERGGHGHSGHSDSRNGSRK
ncbi:hypothetical protein [Spirosoma validum]|uniref:Uncharacterized protein n=1 Tax=Spirosoma validum TaxID=2771355 RepID=A0A927AXK7_9BACT|nr:hypothetical protein [Spirosoma validum]MBD2751547.1 hypothetical protein [Spirosoma validum]